MDWKIGVFVVSCIAIISLIIWDLRLKTSKSKLKFILYTICGCLTYPPIVYVLSSTLFQWFQTGNIIDTANCSFGSYPLCFLGHSAVFIVFAVLFLFASFWAWRDLLKRRTEPFRSNHFFDYIYYNSWLIERNWLVIPLASLGFIAIWAGII